MALLRRGEEEWPSQPGLQSARRGEASPQSVIIKHAEYKRNHDDILPLRIYMVVNLHSDRKRPTSGRSGTGKSLIVPLRFAQTSCLVRTALETPFTLV